MKFTAILLDDEIENNQLLNHFLVDYCPDIEVIALCDSFKDGYKKISSLKPDIVFMDVILGPTEDSFQLLELLKEQNIKVIFVTAHEDFAAKAFRFSAIDYLLKPIQISELVAAVEKAVSVIQMKQVPKVSSTITIPNLTDKISGEIQIQTKGKQVFCNINDILYLEASRQSTIFFLQNGAKIESNKTLGAIEESLNPHVFLRIHKSYTVNVQFVTALISNNGSFVELQHSLKLPLSRRKKIEVTRAIHQYKLQ